MLRVVGILLLIMTGMANSDNADVIIWKVMPESYLEVIGKTNVNKFNCATSSYTGSEYIREYSKLDDGFSVFEGEISLQAESFDCGNRMMNKDFNTTLCADRYPSIIVDFVELAGMIKSTENEDLVGIIEITLSGVKKEFPIECNLKGVRENQVVIAGEKALSFSDFKLTPPQKFFGTVQVKDSIDVKFSIALMKN